MLITILVPAKNLREARTKAEEVVNELVNNGVFDYGVFFDEESPVAGKARWGPLPVATPYNSRVGKRLIKQGIRYTWNEFYDGYRNLKRCLRKYTARELFEEKILSKRNSIRKVMEKITNKKNSDFFYLDLWLEQMLRKNQNCYVYAYQWGRIKSNSALERLFKFYKLSEREEWWVVPVDVHY